MTALSIFEELRFILELIIAEQIFVWAFAKRKRNFTSIFWGGLIFLVLIAGAYPLLQNFIISLDNDVLTRIVSIVWYISLVALSLIYVWFLYEISVSDLLFMGIAGYSLQHIEFVVINEVLALGIWPALREQIVLYILISVMTTALWYSLIIKIFASKLKLCNGIIFDDQIKNIFLFILMFIVLLFTTFLGQHLFVNGSTDYDNINYLGATYDFLSSILIIIVQYSIFTISTLNREKEIVKQLLYERQKQYMMSKENIDIINQKCHDLKHQIQVLRRADQTELEEYFNEVEESIMFYDTVIKTENEVLNTILSEKSLYCEKHHIKLSCIIDASQLDFMSTRDIYVLFGNALDNAIECVINHNDEEKRIISVNISANGNFLSIQTNNYIEGNLQFDEGLPMTTKKNKAMHGYGIKSMRHIAQKYNGSLYTSIEKDVFMLQIVIPIPAEYTRLLKETKKVNQGNHGV